MKVQISYLGASVISGGTRTVTMATAPNPNAIVFNTFLTCSNPIPRWSNRSAIQPAESPAPAMHT